MFTSIADINWVGVLLAFVAYSALGALWFTALFARPYRDSLGRAHEAPQKPAPIFIIGPTICALVITVATALLIAALHIDSYAGALAFSMVVGIGFLFANTVNIAINPNMPKPLYYGLITGMYHLIGITIVSTIIVAMN